MERVHYDCHQSQSEIEMKEFIRRNLRRFDIDVARASFRRTTMEFITDRDIDVVLDVGANVGQFATSLRAKGYTGEIVSFEPVPSVFQTLADAAQADANWDVHNFALGAVAEHATINVAESTVFSSLLPSTDAAAAFTETAVHAHPELIEVKTLDDVLPDVSGNVLLKIDTQGFEKQVLEGARKTLPSLKGVLMELPIIHLYEGNWQFHEAVAFMAEAGFVPAQIHPVNFHWIDKMSLVEVDCLFRPLDPRLDAHEASA
jgi:FkbM family methyltransferase